MGEQNKSHGVFVQGKGRQCQVCKHWHGFLYQCEHYNSKIITEIIDAELNFELGVQEQIREMKKARGHRHQLKWDPSRSVWACMDCPVTFGTELTYPANSIEEAKRLIDSLGDFIKDDPASIGS